MSDISMNNTANLGLNIMARNAVIGFVAALLCFGAIQLNAQALGSHNSNAPVTFDADHIDFLDREKRVVLSGNVIISQSGLRLNAPRTLINYTDGNGISVDRITATGGVTVARAGESARGDVAIYDFNRRIITMAGNVRLNRNGDTLNGGRLIIDLRSGISSIDGRASGSSSATGTGATTGSGGRVSGSFSVPDRGEEN